MYNEQKQINWYSGLYLQPQHFQSIDLHHSYMLAQHRSISQPWNFGYYDFKISNDALNESVLKIDSLKAILPSGYYLEYPGNCTIPQKLLFDSKITDGHPITFWIALRRFDPRFSNVSDNAEKIGNTRWVSSEEEPIMRDIYHDGPETEITRISYNLHIITDDEKNHIVDCELLPLTRLIYENNSIIVDPNFIPPSLTISHSEVLKRIINDIYSNLCSCASKLEECKHTELNSVSFRKQGNIIRLLMLCIFNRTLPLLESWQQEKNVHPWDFFNLLCQLAGELSSFDKTASTTTAGNRQHCFVKYNHYDLFTCFSSIKCYLSNLLPKLSLDESVSVPLQRISSGIFSGNIIIDNVVGNESVYLMLRSNTISHENKLLIHTPDIKVASVDDINTLIQHALPGIPMKLIEFAPGGLPERVDTIWLKIDTTHNIWENIQERKNIAFYWVAAPDDLYIELVIVASPGPSA
ncbi:type VI secretion system baseplate subunit TssK [Raoultella planticola]|jgi:type VI secretion system protein ImpJ|uniref:type VI secretion system baseplate subunit TssK n=1 Tax=Raoultella planticola TaxID=575 RepID=UPI00330CC26A|nr:type VI secretion system baseplate subunit TssK [Raoultella planticola]